MTLFELATHAPGDTFGTASLALRIGPSDATVPTARMVRIPGILPPIWGPPFLTPHLRDQAIARMARKPTHIGLPSHSSCLALRSRGGSGFAIGEMNFTHGTDRPTKLFPIVKSALSLRAGSPKNLSGYIG